jgi:hypothetical protein
MPQPMRASTSASKLGASADTSAPAVQPNSATHTSRALP